MQRKVSLSFFFFYLTKFFIKKKLFSIIGWHSEAATGQAGWWCGRARARRSESWQQEGEASHKVATQSSRLACLSRVNITPRLHTVMTNSGGREQKYYKDYCLVLPDPTHAFPIIFELFAFLKPSRVLPGLFQPLGSLLTSAPVCLRQHNHAQKAAELNQRKDR